MCNSAYGLLVLLKVFFLNYFEMVLNTELFIVETLSN